MKPDRKKPMEATLRVRVSAEVMSALRLEAARMGLTLSKYLRKRLSMDPSPTNGEAR